MLPPLSSSLPLPSSSFPGIKSHTRSLAPARELGAIFPDRATSGGKEELFSPGGNWRERDIALGRQNERAATDYAFLPLPPSSSSSSLLLSLQQNSFSLLLLLLLSPRLVFFSVCFTAREECLPPSLISGPKSLSPPPPAAKTGFRCRRRDSLIDILYLRRIAPADPSHFHLPLLSSPSLPGCR